MENDEKTQDPNQKVFSFGKYLSYFFLIIAGIFIATFLILIFNFLNAIIFFFYLFEVSFPIRWIFSLIRHASITDIAIIFVAFSAFLYMLRSISDKGYMVYDSDEIEIKYYQSLNLLHAILNYTILVPLVLFLFLIVHRWYEAVILIVLYLICLFVAVPSITKYSQVIYDYTQLSQLSPAYFEKQYENFIGNKKPSSWWSYISDKEARKAISSFVVTSLKDKEGRQKILSFLYNGLILYIVLKRDQGYKALIVLLLLLPFIEFYFSFNLLSILYIELTLLFWYFIFCVISILPKGPVTIHLMGKDIKFAYIIEDSDKGYINIISATESPKRISKNSVRFLEGSPKIKPQVKTLPKPLPSRNIRNTRLKKR